MKQILVVAITLIASIPLFAQQTNPQPPKPETKFEQFSSKSGTIVRFTDYPTENFKRSFQKGETKIRKVTYGANESRYFLKITNEGQYSTSTAMIEYSDLLEILKAITVLKQSESTDVTNPNYTENKFRTSDGFEIGYYTSNGKTAWYLQLEKFGRDNTIFPSGTSNDIEQIFITAKNKIEELKK
jgi:hypothetical protein